MHSVWRWPDTAEKSVDERFESLFHACPKPIGTDTLETVMRRCARLVFEGEGSIVITTHRYDPRTMGVLKSLSARGRKIGPKTSKRFEWTIPLSQLEEMCRYLPQWFSVIDGFIEGGRAADHSAAIVMNGGVVEEQFLYSKNQAPGLGEIYRRSRRAYVCIRHESTTHGADNIIVVSREASKEEAACIERSQSNTTVPTH